jgi:aspartyl/asparaginyl-tRNA synthetase
MALTETFALQEHLTTYFERKGASTTFDGKTLEANFPGDLATVTTFMRESLEATLGNSQPVKTAYYQDIINAVDIHGYRNGDPLPWQHAVRIHGMPVIATHYPSSLRPQATTLPRLPHISNSADLILPTGPAMTGYETPNGAHLSIRIDAIESYTRA